MLHTHRVQESSKEEGCEVVHLLTTDVDRFCKRLSDGRVQFNDEVAVLCHSIVSLLDAFLHKVRDRFADYGEEDVDNELPRQPVYVPHIR